MTYEEKKKSGVYAYLDTLNVLNSGSEELIAATKKAYWKAYKAEWRRQRRCSKNYKDYTVTLNSHEVQIVAVAAMQHKRSKTQFIKDACLAYAQQKFVVPDATTVAEIKHFLRLCYTTLQQAINDNRVLYRDGFELMQTIETLEHTVLSKLQTPPSFDSYILETLRNDPHYKERILELCKTM